MRVLDLFSGVGGFALGLEQAGMRTIGFCEAEPFRRLVLRLHWPDVHCWPDVRELTADAVAAAVGRPDLVCFGSPCQDLSCAGKGAGIHGPRSGLFWEAYRLLRDLRPRWLLFENVPALRTRGADEVLPALEELGYTCWPLVVGAWAAGAPHRRNRVWIVGRLAHASQEQQQDRRPGQTAREGASSSPERGRPRWPAGRGEQQHAWEAPRTVPAAGCCLGFAASGLPVKLARRAHRLAVEAVGDSVVPPVVAAIGRAIMQAAGAAGEE